MTEETWRPLGVNSDEEIAHYDALHEGVPSWMRTAFWEWIRSTLTVYRSYSDGSGRFPMVGESLVEGMCQTLRIPLESIRMRRRGPLEGETQFEVVLQTLVNSRQALTVADYLLAHADNVDSESLGALLVRSKSAWTVGTRAGHRALVRRVPAGVQMATDSVMERAGSAGVRLAKAWEALYGIEPNASIAYSHAVKAVEDAAIHVVSPSNYRATLGTVLAQLENQGDWKLPMEREHEKALSPDVLIGMMRILWHGQHDRHGGQNQWAPGDVSLDEATVAVSLAVTLVNLFDAGVIARPTS